MCLAFATGGGAAPRGAAALRAGCSEARAAVCSGDLRRAKMGSVAAAIRARRARRASRVAAIRCSADEKKAGGAGGDSDGEKSDSESASSAARQLLGMKGAADETNIWKIRLQLTKPVTWVPLIWGVTCGAAASGQYHWNDPQDIAKAVVCMIMSGPLLTGFTQTINDWYDRDIDAINEPYRPIPSGRISEGEVKAQIALLLAGGLGTAYALDVWSGHETPLILITAIFGSLVSYIYSAPPLKLKQNGWLGNYALGASYISLPWWAGQLTFGTLDWKTMVLTLFYSLSGLGIAIVNDFKSIEGDRALGLQSLPVAFGVDTAKWICVGTIDVFQALVAIALLAIGETNYAIALAALILPQMFLQQKYFLKDPIEYDVKYQASAQPFLVLGILVTGLAIGHHGPL
mmetsp:Transcript_15571/g.41916  ORF Transcript_15571/g.41916 Transcript_15571/m.41916 type:complete len:403 (-) Transcript_15571:832-2040(-)